MKISLEGEFRLSGQCQRDTRRRHSSRLPPSPPPPLPRWLCYGARESAIRWADDAAGFRMSERAKRTTPDKTPRTRRHAAAAIPVFPRAGGQDDTARRTAVSLSLSLSLSLLLYLFIIGLVCTTYDDDDDNGGGGGGGVLGIVLCSSVLPGAALRFAPYVSGDDSELNSGNGAILYDVCGR